MSYKVFLIEDEIITREGIRDHVDWESVGFKLCGEASDGEVALPLIEETKPDLLITDIKMPFMDGLQLSKIVREHMPWIKIIILSGHDEFEYAQSAVKLGVTEYLLKPVSAQDLHRVLRSLSAVLDQEKQSREKLKSLQVKVEDTLALSREKFLLNLLMGGVSSADAIEQSQQFGIDIVAQFYLVILIRIELCDGAQPFDFHQYQRVEEIVSQFAGNNLDVFLTKKDFEELILLIKGNDQNQLLQEWGYLAGVIKTDVEKQTACNIVIEIGSPQKRLGDIHRSFAEALVKSKSAQTIPLTDRGNPERVELIKVEHAAIERYLKVGSIQDFDTFFAETMHPLVEIALQSRLMKQYLFVDIILTVSQFVSDLGGKLEDLSVDVYGIDQILNELKSFDQVRAKIKRIFLAALTIRNRQINHERALTLQQAKSYLDSHFSDPELQMSQVAQAFNISNSHFSTVFRQEFGGTYRDYLSELRVNHAKELLRTTAIQCAEVAYQSGFSDPHYFSTVFKKKTGLTPQQFREQAQDNKKAQG